MRASALTGIIFANAHDDKLKQLTQKRSIASVPFGARYRLVDFALSNLVNAGVGSVALITKENYRSLMDHVGNGVHWDLDRKLGGLYIMPPYNSIGVKRYSGNVEALMGAKTFFERSNADYVVLCDADVAANVDIQAAVDAHVEKNADITVVYHNGKAPKNHNDVMFLEFNKNGRVTDISFENNTEDNVDYGINISIIRIELLQKLIDQCIENEGTDINQHIFAEKYKGLKIYGYRHEGFAAILDSVDTYFNANMKLLEKEVRNQLFCKERPIFTKTRDDMPTKYGTKSKVSNSYIADGCVIEGTVINSILFRGVTVSKGTTVENSILMQGVNVDVDCQLNYVVSDKDAVISEGMVIKGTKNKSVIIKKKQIV